MDHISSRITDIVAKQGKPMRDLQTDPDLTQLPGSEKQYLCPDCQDMGFYRQDVPVTHPDFGKVVACQNPAHSDERLKRISNLSQLKETDMDRRLADIKVTDLNRETIMAARQMIKTPFVKPWLYIWGPPGNAKTEILIAIVNELNETRNGPAVYTSFLQIINYIRAVFSDKNDNYLDRFNQIVKAKVLAIDEMDAARDTAFGQEFRFHFLDERYRQAIHKETITIFSSNTDPAEFPEAIYDRVRDGRFKVVKNEEGSARPFMKW